MGRTTGLLRSRLKEERLRGTSQRCVTLEAQKRQLGWARAGELFRKDGHAWDVTCPFGGLRSDHPARWLVTEPLLSVHEAQAPACEWAQLPAL